MVNSQVAYTHCPFTQQPFAECATKVLSGISIPKISRYCMGDYALCPVYKTQHKEMSIERF